MTQTIIDEFVRQCLKN